MAFAFMVIAMCPLLYLEQVCLSFFKRAEVAFAKPDCIP
jgi:hypothetical protein